jgi:ankyrin repeat protein
MSAEFLSAVKAGDVARVKDLLNQDPSLKDTKTKEGVHAAVLALYYGQPDVATTILSRGPTLDIHAAASLGDLKRVQALVEADPAAVHAFSGDGFPPLGLAAYLGHKDVVE